MKLFVEYLKQIFNEAEELGLINKKPPKYLLDYIKAHKAFHKKQKGVHYHVPKKK